VGKQDFQSASLGVGFQKGGLLLSPYHWGRSCIPVQGCRPRRWLCANRRPVIDHPNFFLDEDGRAFYLLEGVGAVTRQPPWSETFTQVRLRPLVLGGAGIWRALA
jgi:hypothetical protein